MDIIDVKKADETANQTASSNQPVVDNLTEVPEKVDDKKKTKVNSKFLPWIIVGIVLVLSVAAAVFYYTKYQDVKTNPSEAIQEKNQAETERVMSNLSTVLIIDEKDKPTVARVDDPEKLKKSNETFYRNVQKGDYLIIFPQRAIIFRESSGQIVNIAPIINTADLKEKQEEQSQQPPADTTTP